MRHEWTTTIVDGFGAEEVDFATRLAAADQSVRDQVDNLILSPLVNGMDGAVLIIRGHADPIDSGGDHRTLLQREGEASLHRAQSAMDTILAMIGRDWLTPPPQAWEDLPYIAVVPSANGAGERIDDGQSEDARKRNRRVFLGVCRFIPDN